MSSKQKPKLNNNQKDTQISQEPKPNITTMVMKSKQEWKHLQHTKNKQKQSQTSSTLKEKGIVHLQ